MSHDLQKAIIVALAVISASVGYYFVYHLPRQEKREAVQQERKEELANIQKCEQLASEYSQKETRDWQNTEGMPLNPEYRFDKETNRCLYKGGYASGKSFSRFIIDLYTNKYISSFTTYDNNLIDGSESDFKAKSIQLFGE